MSSPKKVFIIGAGPSGLVALKEMLEAGLDVICVEAKPQIGGLFSVSYEELYTTTTNMFLAFSDFPPKGNLKYWSKDEYLQYLGEYVDHFGLRKYIKLNTAVKKCVLDEHTGKWKILTKAWQSRRGEMRRGSISFRGDVEPAPVKSRRSSTVFRIKAAPGYTYNADFLIVASGTNQVPRVPDLPNCSAEIVHSADFTNAESLCKGKKVLVIGSGESASDVAAQSTDVADKVTLFARRDFDLAPRFISKFLTEAGYDERKILHEQDQHVFGPHDMLESITNSRVLSKLPLAIFSLALDAMLSETSDLHGEDSAAGIITKIDKKNFKKDFYAFDTSAPTKSGGVLAHAVACKGLDIVISPRLDFTEDGTIAHFENVSFMGKEETVVDKVDVKVDVVILCTGFTLNLDWIELEGMDHIEANPRKWFKHCFPPGLGSKIAFLGYARPAQGGIPQCSELLARYVALLLKEERMLPEDFALQALREGQAETETFYATPNNTSLVEFSPFANSLARLIGCEPSAPIFFSPLRFIKFWTLPLWNVWYRLEGPGANPDACWDVVDKYRTFDTLVPMPLLIIFILYSALIQPFMIIEYISSILIDRGLASSLPRFYKWRIGGHFFQLSGNIMRLSDLIAPSVGFLLIEMLLVVAAEITSARLVVAVLLFGGSLFVCLLIGKTYIPLSSKGGNHAKTQQSTKLLPNETSHYGSVV